MPITGMARDQCGHRVADAERVLGAWQDGPEPDELRPQRQRRQGNRDEQADAAAQSPVLAHLSS